jgi:hypothetical protein
MEEDCIGSQGTQRTVVLEEEEKKKKSGTYINLHGVISRPLSWFFILISMIISSLRLEAKYFLTLCCAKFM